jgi:hypothetical protein
MRVADERFLVVSKDPGWEEFKGSAELDWNGVVISEWVGWSEVNDWEKFGCKELVKCEEVELIEKEVPDSVFESVYELRGAGKDMVNWVVDDNSDALLIMEGEKDGSEEL